jgi:hypothetical protein
MPKAPPQVRRERVRLDPRLELPTLGDQLADLPALVPSVRARALLGGVSRDTLRRHVRRGALRALKSTRTQQGRLFVTRDSLIGWLREQGCLR